MGSDFARGEGGEGNGCDFARGVQGGGGEANARQADGVEQTG